ncbi:hypothetical protein J27TS8_36820 [Robertmurraya siralis]|uniref:Group-specific protein n=1 Tax=Robertmurraya siralis TaxID=77777 RepID=A0A919WLA9_9BACI|nr:zf-HC2 domain-containing protein [Robertmurraya siralis]PAE21314.1 hypothetical protein CHH80_07565 [Bacillus sp. 7504-2]GIN63689.1 hypothetical protein J27TS8_36820 [Robertmurraya siralis]
MTHISYDEWKRYVENELNERDRERYEDHLYTCDQCLELYLEAVTELEPTLPVLSNTDDFTNAIMAQVIESKEKEIDKKVPFYQKTLFHYTIAAAMTLLFMASGIFQSITNYVDAVEGSELKQSTPSVTEELVNKTFAWMDQLKNKGADN